MIVAACVGGDPPPERVLLVTTTTVEGSGLLEHLLAAYHASQSRYQVAATAVGSGAALELGRRGEGDLLLTHDPEGEALFMAEGHGTEQGPVMENEFVLAGPSDDPAGIDGMTDLAAAMDAIARAGAPFISRSDESGTHHREKRLWEEVGRSPTSARTDWYVSAGSSMDETLRIASQRRGYVLTDLATFEHLRPRLGLRLVARGTPPVVNRYTYTLPVDPRNPEGAHDFLDWLLGPGQAVIAEYGVDRFGDPLFRPTADDPGD